MNHAVLVSLSLRYGTVPIVRATGGLKDTVEAYNNYTQTGNGFFSFNNYNAHELLFSIKRAIDGIADDRKHIHSVENAMNKLITAGKNQLNNIKNCIIA